jgi:hypothetical protein
MMSLMKSLIWQCCQRKTFAAVTVVVALPLLYHSNSFAIPYTFQTHTTLLAFSVCNSPEAVYLAIILGNIYSKKFCKA